MVSASSAASKLAAHSVTLACCSAVISFQVSSEMVNSFAAIRWPVVPMWVITSWNFML